MAALSRITSKRTTHGTCNGTSSGVVARKKPKLPMTTIVGAVKPLPPLSAKLKAQLEVVTRRTMIVKAACEVKDLQNASVGT